MQSTKSLILKFLINRKLFMQIDEQIFPLFEGAMGFLPPFPMFRLANRRFFYVSK